MLYTFCVCRTIGKTGPHHKTTSYLLKFALTFSRFLKGAFLSNTFKLESCCSTPLFLPPALLLVWASQASGSKTRGILPHSSLRASWEAVIVHQ
jgi:hypothetical protein